MQLPIKTQLVANVDRENIKNPGWVTCQRLVLGLGLIRDWRQWREQQLLKVGHADRLDF